ncbi:MAG: septum formation initiator family protein [Candidatus Andersenbacteria bacterium]
MTANIQQNVVPRHRHARSFSHYVSLHGTWATRQIRSAGPWHTRAFPRSQRGSVTQSTVTIAFTVMSFVLVALLGFFYLQQVFTTASQGSDVQVLESKIVELRERQKELELEGANLRSIQAVEQRVQKLNMVTVDEVAYLATQPDKVAVVAD